MATNQKSDEKQTGKQGFASMDPERQREIASQGGRASHSGGSRSDNKSSVDEKSDTGTAKGSGTQGGSSEQHAAAGRQGNKSSK